MGVPVHTKHAPGLVPVTPATAQHHPRLLHVRQCLQTAAQHVIVKRLYKSRIHLLLLRNGFLISTCLQVSLADKLCVLSTGQTVQRRRTKYPCNKNSAGCRWF